MKKILIVIGLILTLLNSISMIGYASGSTEFASAESVMKIRMDGTVKRAKEIGSGNGIEFMLPDLSDSKYNIFAVELAVFEKKQGESIWGIYKNQSGAESKKSFINNPASLKMQIDFGL
jgi:hypothetical protein